MVFVNSRARKIEPATQTTMKSFLSQMNPSYIRKISGGRVFVEKHLNQRNL